MVEKRDQEVTLEMEGGRVRGVVVNAAPERVATCRAHIFGRALVWDFFRDNWRYSDTNELIVPDELIDWPCPGCGQKISPEGHDPCIRNLPGVKYACCGHGVSSGYIAFENGVVIRGDFVEIQKDGIDT